MGAPREESAENPSSALAADAGNEAAGNEACTGVGSPKGVTRQAERRGC